MHSCIMARNKRRRRRMGRYIRGDIDEELTIGTLVSKTLISTPFDNVVIERTLVSSVVVAVVVENWTPGADIGPLVVGIAHSDYTSAEIEEVIEATLSWSESDKKAQEVAKRQVRRFGILTAPPVVGEGRSLNHGDMFKVKLNWILNTGQTLRLWAYNAGGANFATTSPEVHLQGHANLWPR